MSSVIAGAPTSSPFNVFENLSKPETRSQLVGLAKNPLVQKAVVAGAKNEAVRSAAISYAKDAVAPNKPQPKERTVTGSSVLGMAKQFENKPIMGQAAPSDSSFRRSQNSDFSFFQPNGLSYQVLTTKWGFRIVHLNDAIGQANVPYSLGSRPVRLPATAAVIEYFLVVGNAQCEQLFVQLHFPFHFSHRPRFWQGSEYVQP